MKYLMLSVAALTLAGCATVIDGTSQEIYLESNVDAKCNITQGGTVIVSNMTVPGSRRIPRRQQDLILDCNAEGYEPAKLALVAGANPLTVVGHMPNSLIGGVLADSVMGGVGEYQNQAYIHLTKKPVL